MTSMTRRLSVSEKIGYGFGDLASNLFWQMFSIFIAKFYTDVFLLSAATMGTMMLVTRMGDAVIDPLIGTIADRTRTRWGHFRPYLVWMAIPMAAAAVLTFTTPSFGGTAKIVYAYATLSLMMIAYSAINIPYSALLGVLTPDSKDRTSVSSYRFVMALIPVFIIVNTALPLAKYFGGSETSPHGWMMTMVVYASIATLLYFATFAMTRERVQPAKHEKTRLREDLRDLSRNRPWVVLSIVGVAALTYTNIRGTAIVYYFDYVVPGGKQYFASVMTTGAVAFVLGVMATSPLSKRFGKRNFYMAAMILTAILTAAFYFVPPGNIALVWTGHALISFCAAPTAPLVWAMYADAADYSEWRCGRRATGLVFSAASFAQKIGWAIGGAGTGWLLAYFGYLPGIAQSPRTVDGIRLMMSLIPAIGAVIAIIALWFYELDEPAVERMGAELARQRSSTASPAAERAPQTAAPAGDSDASTLPPLLGAGVLAGEARPRAVAYAEGLNERTASQGAAIGSQGNPGKPGRRFAGEMPPPQPALTVSETDDIRREFGSLLAGGLHGICFSPYLDGQAPGSAVDAGQIRARLEVLKPHVGWVRTFSCLDGHEQTPRLARELGFKTLVGAWLGTDPVKNEAEIANVIAVGRAGDADIIAVGNEVLLREDMSEAELLEYIGRVKRALPGVPVGYVDAYYLFELHPAVARACDVVLTNCYPFWEGYPREAALPYMQQMYRRAAATAEGKPVIIAETGWPNSGAAFDAAEPSERNAMQYFIDTQRWAREAGIPLFYFSAFDEPWKVGPEGDVGAYWGLWDKHGRQKYV